ncbi:MAG: hypothetical protein H7832_15065 [Magnetococcus sp. DMHC-6]
MNLTDNLLTLPPFNFSDVDRKKLYWPAVIETFKHHESKNEIFQSLCQQSSWQPEGYESIIHMPFIPVQSFKQMELISVPHSSILDIRNSSSTSSAFPSVVQRDAVTLDRYRKSRNAVLDNYCQTRYPIQIGVIQDPKKSNNSRLSANLVVDVIESRSKSNHTYYVIEEQNETVIFDFKKFINLYHEYQDGIGLVFGHTAYIYLFLTLELKRRNKHLHLSNTTMLHGWGWKKYADKAVSHATFMADIQKFLGIPASSILDMYGFAESNTLYLECCAGFRHVPLWEDVLIRDPVSLEILPDGEDGLLQFISAIPMSYPGVSILTDDIGSKNHEEMCPCGRQGVSFKVKRRANKEDTKAMEKIAMDLVHL